MAILLAHDGHRVTVFSEVLEPGFELNGAVDNVQVKSPNSLAKQIRELFRIVMRLVKKFDWNTKNLKMMKFPTICSHFSDLFITHSMLKSLSRNPVTEPNYYSRLDLLNRHPLSFLCRLITARDALIEQMSVLILGDRFIKRSANKLAIDTGFSKLFSVRSSYSTRQKTKHSSITFVDYFDKPYWPTAISNSIVFTTPPCDVPQPLSNEIKQFVDDPRSKGTIYMAFGSLVNWATAPDNVIQSFIDAFNSLHDYRIIWTSGEKLPLQLRTHIKTLSWAPQAALLHHNRTKLFITHAGLKSLKESICASVPIVAVPFFADQMKNSLIAKNLGFAEIIHKRRITSTVVLNTLRLMLEGDSYRERILSVCYFKISVNLNDDN
ncbi:unnamed protein product [Anisakis simplex]|uniref:UDP-glucuronosyltransferase n=1 Tax=Anisakis simplex TaxID=6269 RepID=A0A0M3K6X1_ANISI|nr:unnamed protein product [Anisakis simplex]